MSQTAAMARTSSKGSPRRRVKVSILAHGGIAAAASRRPRVGHARLPGPPAVASGVDQPAQRLSRSRRGHRHEHGAHARIGRLRARRRRRKRRSQPPEGLLRHRPRVADGGEGELGGDPVAAAAGHLGRARPDRGRRWRTARCSPRPLSQQATPPARRCCGRSRGRYSPSPARRG